MKPSRNLWPLGIISFFVLLFCGIISVVVICVTHSESLVSETYYEQELNFQNQLDSAGRAQKAGASISRDSVSGNIVVSLPASQIAQKVTGKIELYRPSDPALDQILELTPQGDGTQTLDASKLTTGLWQISASWNAGGQSYYLQQRVVLPRK